MLNLNLFSYLYMFVIFVTFLFELVQWCFNILVSNHLYYSIILICDVIFKYFKRSIKFIYFFIIDCVL